MTRLAVFDCDGTLIDGQAAVCEAMRSGFETVGLPVPPDHEIRRIVGLSLPVAIRGLVPDASSELVTQAVEAYRAAFFAMRQEGRVHEPLYNGIRELLEALRGNGWDLAVATGKSQRGAERALTTHGIADLFNSVQTADNHPSKPDPAMLQSAMDAIGAAPEHTVMIGDTAYDMAMARSAGVRAIGVGWGYHAPEELYAGGADEVADDPDHLEELLR
ncbi:MAG: HAD-IA family hydrolase [Candidatus Andeanibacterium colombiense]|uniref:HAD-IA family hydrolase n=1 Tax=Candidatus Andeanibacterium colombiense TaxID=3121345 RepID=A0AAJ5X982_9SPHN|nr:MAG: HAD-IA family hydrolase [Sphingomonadaceae bacterium]